METTLKIDTPTIERDYFPSIFVNKDNTIVILADGKTSEKTFSGMIIHSESESKKALKGTYSTGWTYTQFKRLPKRSVLNLKIVQGEI
jgi:hypothetical protein